MVGSRLLMDNDDGQCWICKGYRTLIFDNVSYILFPSRVVIFMIVISDRSDVEQDVQYQLETTHQVLEYHFHI